MREVSQKHDCTFDVSCLQLEYREPCVRIALGYSRRTVDSVMIKGRQIHIDLVLSPPRDEPGMQLCQVLIDRIRIAEVPQKAKDDNCTATDVTTDAEEQNMHEVPIQRV